MPLRWGVKHGAIGLVSAVLAIKLLVKKGLFLIDDVVTHQFVHVPLELVVVELPVSAFGAVGAVVVSATGSDLPATAVGMVLVYPMLVVLVTAVLETPTVRLLAAYWVGATAVTGFAVAASLGIAPDPAGAGSGLAHHVEHHTVAVTVRSWILGLGEWIAAVATRTTGAEVDEAVGLAVAVPLVAICYGVVWELHVGHE